MPQQVYGRYDSRAILPTGSATIFVPCRIELAHLVAAAQPPGIGFRQQVERIEPAQNLGGMHRPVRIPHHLARQRHEIAAAVGEIGFRLRRAR